MDLGVPRSSRGVGTTLPSRAAFQPGAFKDGMADALAAAEPVGASSAVAAIDPPRRRAFRPPCGASEARRRETSPSVRRQRPESMPRQASISPFTASTEVWNMAFSSSLKAISTIFSTPPEPITTGTPT